jgi:hypothetical protein
VPNWKKWQKVWNHCITNYTPRTKQEQPDVNVKGIFQKWNTGTKRKKEESQIQTIMISESVLPMFGQEIVVQYRQYNESYCPSAQIKTADAAQ